MKSLLWEKHFLIASDKVPIRQLNYAKDEEKIFAAKLSSSIAFKGEYRNVLFGIIYRRKT